MFLVGVKLDCKLQWILLRVMERRRELIRYITGDLRRANMLWQWNWWVTFLRTTATKKRFRFMDLVDKLETLFQIALL